VKGEREGRGKGEGREGEGRGSTKRKICSPRIACFRICGTWPRTAVTPSDHIGAGMRGEIKNK
jgi:hypothetical protein